jgi:hypothetical protein
MVKWLNSWVFKWILDVSLASERQPLNYSTIQLASCCNLPMQALKPTVFRQFIAIIAAEQNVNRQHNQEQFRESENQMHQNWVGHHKIAEYCAKQAASRLLRSEVSALLD